ncbi:MAG TPA: hypothetical protein VL995_18430 [Cellvibrio sp.]|nr:hypothetical protein [Cellvibrio sp.]
MFIPLYIYVRPIRPAMPTVSGVFQVLTKIGISEVAVLVIDLSVILNAAFDDTLLLTRLLYNRRLFTG